MRLLITGVAGFLGTHVAEHFRNLGWEVIGIDNLADMELKRASYDVKKSREHNLKFLEEIGVEFHKKDCRDLIPEEFQKLDFIVHCAAQPAMTIAIENPVYDMDNNIRSTIKVLEVAKWQKCPIVTCSSIHVYGNSLNSSLVEKATRFERPEGSLKEIDEYHEILRGDLTPLHVSKRAVELYTLSYAETYKMRAATFRLTGMYGERQFAGMDHGWVSNFAIRTVKHRQITIFGTDKQVRDILYAKDAARAFEFWFKNNGKSEVYNIGGGYKNSISLGECLKTLSQLNPTSNQKITIEKPRFGDLYYFVCDYKKAMSDFSWSPETSPDDGLIKLNNWIIANNEIL